MKYSLPLFGCNQGRREWNLKVVKVSEVFGVIIISRRVVFYFKLFTFIVIDILFKYFIKKYGYIIQ